MSENSHTGGEVWIKFQRPGNEALNSRKQRLEMVQNFVVFSELDQ